MIMFILSVIGGIISCAFLIRLIWAKLKTERALPESWLMKDSKFPKTPVPESWLVKDSKSLKRDPTFKIRSW